MKNEEQLLLFCLRQQFEEPYLSKTNQLLQQYQIDWDFVLETAVYHKVAPLIYINLQKCIERTNAFVPEDTLFQFKTIAAQNSIETTLRENCIVDAVNYLHSQKIDVMFVKGIALDILVYEEPWYTSPSDIDLVIRSESPITSEQREIIRSFEQFAIECDKFTHHDITMNNILPVDFNRIWHDAETIYFRGSQVFVMSPEDMLIAACINSGRKRYFNLKAILDISETILCTEINWDLFIEKSFLYDVTNIVRTALWVTSEKLEMPLPNQVLDSLKGNRLRESLIQKTVSKLQISDASDIRHGSGTHFLGRRFSRSAILRFLTLKWYQIGGNLRFIFHTSSGEYEFWDGQ